MRIILSACEGLVDFVLEDSCQCQVLAPEEVFLRLSALALSVRSALPLESAEGFL